MVERWSTSFVKVFVAYSTYIELFKRRANLGYKNSFSLLFPTTLDDFMLHSSSFK